MHGLRLTNLEGSNKMNRPMTVFFLTLVAFACLLFGDDISLPIFESNEKHAQKATELSVSLNAIVFDDCEPVSVLKLDKIPAKESDPKVQELAACIRNYYGKGDDRKAYRKIRVSLKADKSTPYSRIFKTINTLAFTGIGRVGFIGKTSKDVSAQLTVSLPAATDSKHLDQDALLLTAVITDTSTTLGARGGWVSRYSVGRTEESFFMVVDSLKTDIDSLGEVYSHIRSIILAFEDRVPFQRVTTVMSMCRSCGIEEISLAKLRQSDNFVSNLKPSSGNLVGGRPRESIQNAVAEHIGNLKRLYDSRVKEKPNLAGKIVVRFAIDYLGNVLKVETVEQTLDDDVLQKRILEEVKSWKFQQIRVKGDVTEVVYPFVFSKP